LAPTALARRQPCAWSWALLRPVSGEIRLFGEPLNGALPGILRRVGSLIEQPSLYDHLTGKENLEIVRRLKFSKRSDADRAIEILGVGEYIGKKVGEYSRGMRQRLGVAIAMLGDPELLLLDEPMNGLDAKGLRTFRSVLQKLHQEYGTTILLSSHQFEEIEQVATHIGIMSSAGDLLFQGPREQLSERVPQELVIKVDCRDDALRILASGSYKVDSRREHLVIQGVTSEMAREVNRLLVTNGIAVHHLALESATLEALFVKVTATVNAWDSV
jgi:lantibiotic transport system ATP-binding protein